MDSLRIERARGFYDLFTLTTQERTAQNLGITEDLSKPKASVDELMQRYIDNCINQEPEHPQDDPKIREFLCLCSAANTPDYLSPADIRTAFSEKKEARVQKERLLALAVMPCMEKPVRHLLTKACYNDPYAAKRTGNIKEVCACAAEEIADETTRTDYGRIAQQNITIVDMLHHIVKGASRGQFYRNNIGSCSYYNQ